MNFRETELSGMFVIEPRVFEDERGFFMETFQTERFTEAGIDVDFVQDNHVGSQRGVLRGLHYQQPHEQGKLVRVVRGAIFDVGVDLRRNSPTFGKWVGETLTAENRREIYVPAEFAHGYCVLSDLAEVIYRCTDFYHPEHERSIRWNDPELGIVWPVGEPILSEKDVVAPPFAEADGF